MQTLACDMDLLARVQSEYREMPGLCLTIAQAQRLFGLDPHRCAAVFHVLTETGFLTRTRAGMYIRAFSA